LFEIEILRCNSATNYYNCIKTRLVNCIGLQYVESYTYYEKIQKYVQSQSNLNCPGGLEGCIVNANDVRCKMGVKYGEINFARSLSDKNFFSFFFNFLLIFNFLRILMNFLC
jgi:hypothetical protein